MSTIDLKTLAHREQFGAWLNVQGLTGEGAEIGVAFGGYSLMVLKQWRGRVYHMVDPWLMQNTTVYREKQDDRHYDLWEAQCRRLAADDTRVIIHKGLSEEVAPRFNNNFLDFAFIDGNHSFDAVSADIRAWYPKVKSGGIICGHDYYNDTNYPHHCEVKRAVEGWSKELGLDIHLTPCSSWWALKP